MRSWIDLQLTHSWLELKELYIFLGKLALYLFIAGHHLYMKLIVYCSVFVFEMSNSLSLISLYSHVHLYCALV